MSEFGNCVRGLGQSLQAFGYFARTGGVGGRIFQNGNDGLNSYGRFLKDGTDQIPRPFRGAVESAGDLFERMGNKINGR